MPNQRLLERLHISVWVAPFWLCTSTPSMMLAVEFASEMITPFPSRVWNRPPLASKQLVYRIVSSNPR